ncbi:MAG: hypothetical protein WKF67_04125 [Rubrobacteraceae bacterium]
MTEPNNELLRHLRKTVDEVDGRLDDLIKAIYGYPALGQKGFQEDMQKNVSKCQDDVKQTKDSLDALLLERREELAERRGRETTMKRIVSFFGVSSIATFLALVGLIITILSSSGITGGP